MSNSNETVLACIYANGRIYNNNEGATFECDDVRATRIDQDITLERLKEVVGEELELPPHQRVSELIYRLPVSINPRQYRTFRLRRQHDVQVMFETKAELQSQIYAVELYAKIDEREIALNTLSQAINESAPSTLPFSQLMHGIDEHSGQFGTYMEPVSPLQPEHDHSQPSSSHAGIGTSYPSHHMGIAPTVPTEDILDDISDEDAYDAIPSDNDDYDDEEAEEENHEVFEETHLTPPIDQHEEPVADFFHQVDTEAARDSGNIALSDPLDSRELRIGLRYPNKQTLRRAVKLYSVRAHHMFKVYYQDKKYEEYRCPHYGVNCNWRVRACQPVRETHWKITKYEGPHTCLSASLSQDHPKLDSDVISSCIVGLVTDNPGIAISDIQQQIRREFGYNVSYRKAWRAKHKAVAIAFGNWESSYALLPRWLAAVQHFMPGSYVEFLNKDCPQTSNGEQNVAMFHRVFWTFKPCIEAFKFLKPIVQVDGTFLYGKYRGTMLMASSQDGNRNVVPIAWALVEGETNAAWGWFLRRVRQHVVKDKQGLCLISDRHAGILSAVSDERLMWQPPYGRHVFCIRHVASNFNQKFKTKWLKEKITSIGMYL